MKKIVIPILAFICGLIAAALYSKNSSPVTTVEPSQSKAVADQSAIPQPTARPSQLTEDDKRSATPQPEELQKKLSELELQIKQVTNERDAIKRAYASTVKDIHSPLPANNTPQKLMDAKGNLVFEYDGKSGALKFDPSRSVILPQDGKVFLNKKDEIAGGLKSTDGNEVATLKFENTTSSDVYLFWIDYAGNPILYDHIAPGGSSTRPTYMSHPWVVTDANGNRLGDIKPELVGKTEVIPIGGK